ncbi:hypothetical protein EYF80_031891 [Liparis tanakae]|uniref:Uncharacterized protein n=1 Tax=Liparis tanakae TaxID=230148 RepID=A0A4Z2GZ10_9TELE|nr:hypothetical protein EYF80_031891 [Liparis tanakae]
MFQHKFRCETFRDVSGLANVSTGAENLTFLQQIREVEEDSRRLIWVEITLTVHFGPMDPSHSTVTGAVSVKLFIPSAKSRAC